MSQKILDEAIKLMFEKHFNRNGANFFNPEKRKSFEKQTKILYGLINQLYDDIGIEEDKIKQDEGK